LFFKILSFFQFLLYLIFFILLPYIYLKY